MRALLAALPIGLLLVLLLGTRIGTAKAASIALATALVLTFAVFGFTPEAGASAAQNLTGVAAEGAFIAATILWILLPALAIHEMQVRSGALEVLRNALAGAAPGAAGSVLVIGWFFALFLEGAAGFGTPLAIAAPMLVAIGVSPVPAVAGALLAHAAGVAFGAVGTPVLAQAELTAAPLAGITRYTALLVIALAWMPALFLLRAARPSSGGAATLPHGLLAALLFSVPFGVVALWIGPELPTLAGALVGGIAFVALQRRSTPAPAVRPRVLLRAAAPYLALIALILATRLFALVKAAATGATLSWELPGGYSGSFVPLYHPGTLLFAALVLGAAIQRVAAIEVARAALRAATRLAPAVLALLAMLALSRLMLHAGMIDALAQTAVRGVGAAWPAVAPAVGALGSFVTGSATASNILFTNLQEQAAASLGLPVVAVLAAQSVGAAVGNAMCPHNIIAGAAAVGAAGREGEILRRTLPACALMLLVAGALALALLHLPE